MNTAAPREHPGPPGLDQLRDRLVGHRFPGGTVRIEPYEAWLGHEAMCAPASASGDTTLSPLWILVIGLRGMGTGIAGLVELAGADPADGVLFGELGLRQDAPLRAGVDYRVSGSITAVTRRTGRRAGLFDQVDFALEIATGDGGSQAGVAASFLFPRGTR